jgi:hypothetical protein
MTFPFVLLETEVGNEIPVSPVAFGLIAFGLLLVLLLVTWSIGKGRPHS